MSRTADVGKFTDYETIEPVHAVNARVRFESLRAVRMFGTALGVPNALITLYSAIALGPPTPLVLTSFALQVSAIGFAWLVTERRHRVVAAVLITLVGALATTNLLIWGVTPGTGLAATLFCVSCSIFYGVRAAQGAWAGLALLLAAYALWGQFVWPPLPASEGTVSVVRGSTATLAVSGVMLALVSAVVGGLERSTRALAAAFQRERASAGSWIHEQERALSLLRAAMDATADGLLIVDHAGKVQGANRQFFRMWHIPEALSDTRDDDVLLTLVREQLVDPDAFLKKVRELYALPDAESTDFVAFKDGREFERVSRPQFLGTEIVGRVWSFRDVTEIRVREAHLRETHKLEAVGLLASGIAHDFGNLLTVVGGRAAVLARVMPHNDPLVADVTAIQNAAERAAALTRRLVAFSRRQVLQPTVLNANVVISELQRLLALLVGEQVELVVTLGDEIGQVRMDRSQLEQVLINLAVNARDAMPDTGRLEISTRGMIVTADDGARGLPYAPGRYVALALTDTGSGMDEETRLRAFEPFFTTKPPGSGSGLGLSVVHGIVSQSGGYVEIQSQVGQGSRFDVYLPVLDDDASPKTEV